MRRPAVLAWLLLCAAGPGAAQTGASADETLRTLFADEWAQRMQDDPLYATQSGVRDYDDRLPGVKLLQDDPDPLLVVGVPPGAEHHRAQAELAHLDPGCTQPPVLHARNVVQPAPA